MSTFPASLSDTAPIPQANISAKSSTSLAARAMAAQTEALSRLDVMPDAEHGPDETGSPRDDYVLVDSGESETPEPVRSLEAMR